MGDDEPVYYILSVSRRRRGIYLATAFESRNADEEADAFGTLAEAKRWCAAFCGAARLSWRETSPCCWQAEVTV